MTINDPFRQRFFLDLVNKVFSLLLSVVLALIFNPDAAGPDGGSDEEGGDGGRTRGRCAWRNR